MINQYPKTYLVAVCGSAMLFVAARTSCGSDSVEPWSIVGEVVDESGDPIPEFEAATFWSANGLQWDEKGAALRTGNREEIVEFWNDEGTMVPWPSKSATTIHGQFNLEIEGDRPTVAVLIMDREHKRGACKRFDKNGDRSGKIVLRPLVRVSGKITCTEAARTPGWTIACVHLPNDFGNWLKPIVCGSVQGKFSFLLPPGDYDLDVYSEDPDARMEKPKGVENLPLYLYGTHLTLSGKEREVDLGTFDVKPTKLGRLQIAGLWGDYAKHYGKKPPKFYFSDARGVERDLQLSDLGGKWVLLDFWNFNCGPCLAQSIPDLMEFYDKHKDQRGRFEIISICVDVDGNLATMEDVDRAMEPHIESLWDGKKPEFPIVVDNQERTRASFGIRAFPTLLLIDPDGNLFNVGIEPPLEVLRSKLE
jgi:thiol-disulfide isomerase/thioredoxin